MNNNDEIKVLIALKKRGKTYRWLADQLNISQSYLSDLVHGYRNNNNQLCRIDELLNTDLSKEKTRE